MSVWISALWCMILPFCYNYCTTGCLYSIVYVVLLLTSVTATSGSDYPQTCSGYQNGSVGFDSSDVKAFASDLAQNRTCRNLAGTLLLNLDHATVDTPKLHWRWPSQQATDHISLTHYDDNFDNGNQFQPFSTCSLLSNEHILAHDLIGHATSAAREILGYFRDVLIILKLFVDPSN